MGVAIRILRPEDVSEDYGSWLEDPEVNRYLECRWRAFSLDDLRAYVRAMNESPKDILFGIFLSDEDRHIGNIKIGNIDTIHRYADIGLLIGAKDAWGKGYGSIAIDLAALYAFRQLNLHKVVAGIYAGNTGSFKAFLKAGFRECGRLTQHRFCDGSYVDEILVERLQGPCEQ